MRRRLLVCSIALVTITACLRDEQAPPEQNRVDKGSENVLATGATTTTSPAAQSPLLPTTVTATSTPAAAQALQSPLLPTVTVMPTIPISATTDAPAPVSAWSRYTHPLGFSLEYPTDWHVAFEAGWSREQGFSFWLAPSADRYGVETFTIDILLNPKVVNGLASPYNAPPNEQPFEAHWPTPLDVPNANGLLYVWGDHSIMNPNSYWDSAPTLQASYYSKLLDMELVIWHHLFDDANTALTQQIGLAEAVKQHFPVFDHMVRSVQFFDPATVSRESPSSLLPDLITTLPVSPPLATQEPVTEWSRYTSPLGFTLSYPANWHFEVDLDAANERLFAFWVAPVADAQSPDAIHGQVLVYPELLDRYDNEPLAFDWSVETLGDEVRFNAPLGVNYGKGFLSSDARGPEVGLLYASYYEPISNTEIMLYQWYTNPEGLTPIDSSRAGSTQAIQERFPIFYYMVTSVHFLNPLQR